MQLLNSMRVAPYLVDEDNTTVADINIVKRKEKWQICKIDYLLLVFFFCQTGEYRKIVVLVFKTSDVQRKFFNSKCVADETVT